MIGKTVRVNGSVVDVYFPTGQLPKINDALYATVNGEKKIMEVAQHIGDGKVRCIMLSESQGMSRNLMVVATGEPIKVPVGQKTLGRLFNVLGEPIDGGPKIEDLSDEPIEKHSIHRTAPDFDEQNPAVEILETRN